MSHPSPSFRGRLRASWRAVPRLLGLAALALPLAPALAQTAPPRPALEPCKLPGVETAALCGQLSRPLDPARADGPRIDVHYAVLPALARNRKPDPVFFFAGGPGQSAIGLAGGISRMLSRSSYRRDIVLVDQRGTGRSAPLQCPELPAATPLAETADFERQLARLQACGAALQKLPHGDLRQYTTTIAMQDVEAVRQALGAPRINLVGGSYGTRAALEYLRQFPQAVRRVVLDGVAPPDMVLPAAFSTDNQAALDAVFAACAAEAGCRERWPRLAEDWRRLLDSLPREVGVAHPLTGQPQRFTLTRDGLLGLVRTPLYVPLLASALPMAVHEASRGRFEPLVGLSTAMSVRQGDRMSEGMHFSVVCAEDLPRLAQAADPPGADFGRGFAQVYERVCSAWPRGTVPEAFYRMPPAPAATLVLSGGADPATPPRHGERSAQALGALARHVTVPHAGHGTVGLPCMREVLHRFIDAETDAAALAVDLSCATAIPRPGAFVPPGHTASPAAATEGSK